MCKTDLVAVSMDCDHVLATREPAASNNYKLNITQPEHAQSTAACVQDHTSSTQAKLQLTEQTAETASDTVAGRLCRYSPQFFARSQCLVMQASSQAHALTSNAVLKVVLLLRLLLWLNLLMQTVCTSAFDKTALASAACS